MRIFVEIIHLLSALGDIIPVERIVGTKWHIDAVEFPFRARFSSFHMAVKQCLKIGAQLCKCKHFRIEQLIGNTAVVDATKLHIDIWNKGTVDKEKELFERLVILLCNTMLDNDL